MKKAAIYCRVAQKDDAEMELQKTQVLQHAAELGYANSVIYADNGASGLTFDRPAFSAMNADIAEGKVDVVLVHSLSCIGRNACETLAWVRRTYRNGVEVLACDGSLDSIENVAITKELFARCRSCVA